MSEFGDVIASQFVIYIIHEIENFIFFPDTGKKHILVSKYSQNKHYFSFILGGYKARFTILIAEI